MVVTRASSNATLSADLGTQLLSRRRSLQIAAGVMVALACIPGLPKVSFLAIAGVVLLLAARLPKPLKDKDGRVIEVADPGALPAAGRERQKAAKSDSIEDLLKLDELSLEVGYALVGLVDVQQGGQLLARVKALRSSLAVQLGFIVPPFISPTTSASSRVNTSSRCAASKSPAGKCSKIRSSPLAPNSPAPAGRNAHPRARVRRRRALD
jgi:flagellar biosynthesis protein FlhA